MGFSALRGYDCFGRAVNFYYKGEQYYSTTWGAFVTMIVVTAYLCMVTLKCIEFFAETDPIFYYSNTMQSMEEAIDLKELGFTFAIEAVADDIGYIELTQVRWNGISGEKES